LAIDAGVGEGEGTDTVGAVTALGPGAVLRAAGAGAGSGLRGRGARCGGVRLGAIDGLGATDCCATFGCATGVIGCVGSIMRASIWTGTTTSGLRTPIPKCSAHKAAACNSSTHAATAMVVRPWRVMAATCPDPARAW